MIQCIFSSVHGGTALKKAILAKLEELEAFPSGVSASVSIFAFSLTDEEIADKLLSVAEKKRSVDFRIIADWSQRGRKGNKQLYRLSQSNLTNISFRFKLDQPYLRSESESRVKWSYRESHGLLHHKSLLVVKDGRFEFLVLGSFNWTKRAIQYYENLLILYPYNPSILDVFHKFRMEFDFMWNDPNSTASQAEANEHFHYIKSTLTGSMEGVPVFDQFGRTPEITSILRSTENRSVLVAFNSRRIGQKESERGYHPQNGSDRFYITKPQGKVKSVPLNISNLVLEIIYKAKEGDDLMMAAYALSAKAVEFGALIEAARRKVNVYLLLDHKINAKLVKAMEEKYALLPIQVRTTSKRLHSKYIVHPASQSVLTGTANFTRDASERHTEHRLLIQDNPEVTGAFLDDFKTIWDRVKKREKDKPRLFLSNNGDAAEDIPWSQYSVNFIKNKAFGKIILFLSHKLLYAAYFLMEFKKKNEKSDIGELLRVIESRARSQALRVFLIGSYVDYIKGRKDSHSSDVDLCICPSDTVAPGYSEIGKFILWIKRLGSKNNISFDVKYSETALSLDDITLKPDQDIRFIKLYSPYLQRKVSKGLLKNHTFLGGYLIQFELKAKETNFFSKLPQSPHDAGQKYLRGAIELGKIDKVRT